MVLSVYATPVGSWLPGGIWFFRRLWMRAQYHVSGLLMSQHLPLYLFIAVLAWMMLFHEKSTRK